MEGGKQRRKERNKERKKEIKKCHSRVCITVSVTSRVKQWIKRGEIGVDGRGPEQPLSTGAPLSLGLHLNIPRVAWPEHVSVAGARGREQSGAEGSHEALAGGAVSV